MASYIDNPPVFIFGNPRSGTRMCANVLNKHPSICVTDEILNIKKALDLCGHAESRFLSNYFDGEELSLRKEMLAKQFFVTRSTKSISERFANSRIEVVGNKTPRLEHKFELIEDFFKTTKPLYIYCLRNSYSVLRSIKNLPNLAWHKNSVKENLENYLLSVRKYKQIAREVPERIRLVNLERIDGPEKNVEFYAPLFDFVGIRLDDESRQLISEMGKQNSMELVHKKINYEGGLVELTEEEVEVIKNNKEYSEVEESFFK